MWMQNNSAKKITPEKLGCWMFRWECEVRAGVEVSSWVCEAKKQMPHHRSFHGLQSTVQSECLLGLVQSRLSPVLLCTGMGLGTSVQGRLHDQAIFAPWQPHRTEDSQWLPHKDASCPCGPQISGTPTVCPQGQLFLDFCLHLRSGY